MLSRNYIKFIIIYYANLDTCKDRCKLRATYELHNIKLCNVRRKLKKNNLKIEIASHTMRY